MQRLCRERLIERSICSDLTAKSYDAVGVTGGDDRSSAVFSSNANGRAVLWTLKNYRLPECDVVQELGRETRTRE